MMEFNKYMSLMTPGELTEACRRIKHVALDMDGTIYLGSRLFPWTIGFLKKLTDNGIGYSFLTNNPTRSLNDYVTKLRGMGIEATREEVYTTAVATIDYIKSHFPAARRLFVLGTPSMTAEFEAAGFEMCADSADDRPDVLVVAFDTTLTYPRLCRAAWWASQGVPYIATNPDRVCPTDQPVVLVDCGSLCECITYATGRKPDIVIGKPNPDMLRGIMERYGLRADEIAMCGDRIYTDVAMARNAGALGVLVLSGETTLETAINSDPQPPITADTVDTFADLLIEARK
ncbi:MAG: HAD-IIA family hydrolase [Bacteroidales bacterium]|nr:HAD-IIA family hydrolase [Bacteroidales bacterium]